MRAGFASLAALLLIAAAAGAAPPAKWNAVQWEAPDGLTLVGAYHPPAKRGKLIWILLHDAGGVKEDWYLFSKQLVGQGYGVLLFDARGHGGSTQRKKGKRVDFRTFQGGEDWRRMVNDLGSAVQLLNKKGKLGRRQIAFAGAGAGANVALLYASWNKNVPAVLMLSPGIRYTGLDIDKAFPQVAPRPVFMAASPRDEYAWQSYKELVPMRTDPGLTAVKGYRDRHGVDLLQGPKFTRQILRWMKNIQ